jgi:hypothetical protein
MLFRRSLFVSFIAALVLALPSVASAQSSLESGYDPQGGEEQAGTSNGDDGALPFTGSNLYVWAGLGLVLLGTGVALRRASGPHAATAGRARPGAGFVPMRTRPDESGEPVDPAALEPTELAYEDNPRKR